MPPDNLVRTDGICSLLGVGGDVDDGISLEGLKLLVLRELVDMFLENFQGFGKARQSSLGCLQPLLVLLQGFLGSALPSGPVVQLQHSRCHLRETNKLE